MTTDNRTNEEGLTEADFAASSLYRSTKPKEAKSVQDFAFTEAQVEAAAKALRADEGFMEGVHSALEVSWSEYIARLVLVAAQGAAPQAGSTAKVVPVSYEASASCSHGVCPKGCSHLMWACGSCSSEGRWGATRDKLDKWAAEHVCPVLPSSGAPQTESDERIQAWELLVEHPVWRSCFGEERPLIDSMMERIDKLAELEMPVNELAPAPVLPSSGVDEEKLAEVIARVTDLWDDPLDEVHDIPQIARAVAEWLEGQGGEGRGE